MDKKEKYLLFLILICAFIIRMPQLNFPSIGYHNMKENEYISMAKNMIESRNYQSREVYFYNAFTDKKDLGLYPQIPFVAYQVLLGYKLFGDNLWFARSVNIALMLLAIAVFSYLTSIFIKERLYSVMAAILLSILPLGVYFSRNLQPESGAFFFMLLGNYLGIKFIQDFKNKYLYGLAICILMVAGYKVPFLFGLAPLAFIFPYRKYISLRGIKVASREMFILILPFLLLVIYFSAIGQASFSASWGRVKFSSIFTVAYWKKYGLDIWDYAKDGNFTFVYLLFFMIGIIKLWWDYKKDRGLFARYLRAWSAIVIPYFIFFSDYLNQHNYYQMPFLGFVCLTNIYIMRELSGYIGNYFKLPIKHSFIFAAIFGGVLFISLLALRHGIDDSFEVIYTGTDEVGKILKGMTAKEDRFFIYTLAQGYAPCVYAERKCGWSDSLAEFTMNEQKFGVKYILIYPYHFINNLSKDIRSYISGSYHIKLAGLILNGNALTPNVVLLEKGGVLNIEEFFSNIKNIKLQKVYDTVKGPVPFYILKEEAR